MKVLKKLAIGFVALLAISGNVSSAFAAGSYISPVSAPAISLSNTIYSSGNWNVATTSGTVTKISWDINYATTTYTIQYRICQRLTSTTPCTAWTTSDTATDTTTFTGNDATKPFFFQSRVVTSPTTTAKTLSPKIYGNGNSMITVTYN